MHIILFTLLHFINTIIFGFKKEVHKKCVLSFFCSREVKNRFFMYFSIKMKKINIYAMSLNDKYDFFV